jgi:hypothetical protein
MYEVTRIYLCTVCANVPWLVSERTAVSRAIILSFLLALAVPGAVPQAYLQQSQHTVVRAVLQLGNLQLFLVSLIRRYDNLCSKRPVIRWLVKKISKAFFFSWAVFCSCHSVLAVLGCLYMAVGSIRIPEPANHRKSCSNLPLQSIDGHVC